jgi:hypothetical protein
VLGGTTRARVDALPQDAPPVVLERHNAAVKRSRSLAQAIVSGAAARRRVIIYLPARRRWNIDAALAKHIAFHVVFLQTAQVRADGPMWPLGASSVSVPFTLATPLK